MAVPEPAPPSSAVPQRQRKVIHVDMDAFFASVEQRDDPALRGKPVAVGSSRERGVVAAASYEARRFGVRSAMSSATARRKCPELVFVRPRFDVYRAVSLQVRAIFAEYTPLIEPLSLDEAYLDVTENLKGLATATLIAKEIRAKIREHTGLRARGELGDDEVVYKAITRRGEAVDEYDLPVATGDRVRLFRRTWARIDGRFGSIGNNGDIVDVVGRTNAGLRLRDKHGKVADVEWWRLQDAETGRLLLGHGHALTIDAAQGITSDEHINALPRGTAGVTGFTTYVAESRARGTTWTMIAEAALFEAVRHGRALGDVTPVTTEDLWHRAARDMAAKPYKPLGMDLRTSARADRARAIDAFIRQSHRLETLQAEGRQLGREARMRVQAETVRGSLPELIAALDAAIVRNATLELPQPRLERELHLRGMRVEAEVTRREVEGVVRVRRLSRRPGK